jgi:DNA-binding GntR family transcriptional regulator
VIPPSPAAAASAWSHQAEADRHSDGRRSHSAADSGADGQAVRAGDTDRYAELVHEFHELIVVGADNSKLEAHYRTLMNHWPTLAWSVRHRSSRTASRSPTANTTACSA